MKKVKKLSALFLAMVMLFALVACGADPAAEEEQAVRVPTRATRKAAIPVTASTGPERTTRSISLRLP